MSTVILTHSTWSERFPRTLLLSIAALGEMSFLEHLEELRSRLIKSLIALAACTGFGFLYTTEIIQFLSRPAADAGIRLIAIDAAEVFAFYFRVAFSAGICLAAPVILWQIWRFIEPALYRHEKRYAAPFIISTTFCFAAGAAFGYAVVAPWLLALERVMAEAAKITFTPSAESYFSMLTATVVAMGGIFEMPPFIFILSRIGLVDARFLIRNFKYAFLIFSLAAALLTPSTTAAPMLFFMAVMIGIYAISVLVAMIFGRSRRTE